MGYRGGELIDLAPKLERGVHRFGRRAVDAQGDELKHRVRRHTPISKPGKPEIIASYGSSTAWVQARGRRPGTLLDSWEKTGVQARRTGGGRNYVEEVVSHDPVAVHVEYDTQPHLIRAKHAKALTIPTLAGMSFRESVRHPGTTGAHMMGKALAELRSSWQGDVRRLWTREARDFWTDREAA